MQNRIDVFMLNSRQYLLDIILCFRNTRSEAFVICRALSILASSLCKPPLCELTSMFSQRRQSCLSSGEHVLPSIVKLGNVRVVSFVPAYHRVVVSSCFRENVLTCVSYSVVKLENVFPSFRESVLTLHIIFCCEIVKWSCSFIC